MAGSLKISKLFLKLFHRLHAVLFFFSMVYLGSVLVAALIHEISVFALIFLAIMAGYKDANGRIEEVTQEVVREIEDAIFFKDWATYFVESPILIALVFGIIISYVVSTCWSQET